MQFLILAYDATDSEAHARRMEVREAHLACVAKYKASGNMKIGAAILDEAGKMIGSVLIGEFPDRAALDVWLSEDPYATHKVWGDIRVMGCKIAPAFSS